MIDAIERIEVAVRARLAYGLARQSGDPFAYATDPAVLPNLTREENLRFLEELADEACAQQGDLRRAFSDQVR